MRTTPGWTPAKQRRRHVIPFSQQTNKANTTFRHHPDTIQTPFRHHPDIIQLLSFIHVCSRCPCKIVFWTKLFEINLVVLTWMQNLPYLIRWHRFSLARWIKNHPIQSGTAPRMRSLCFTYECSAALVSKIHEIKSHVMNEWLSWLNFYSFNIFACSTSSKCARSWLLCCSTVHQFA